MEKWWKNYPWRVVQANFREIDTVDFDPQQFVDTLLDIGCNAVMLNAAGTLANYQTKLEGHAKSDYLDGFDLKALVELCQQNGIKAIARTDFSKIRRDIYEKHPDWAYRTPEGEIIDYNGYVHTCPAGDYQKKYMDLILEEMLADIPFDGIYGNMGGFSFMAMDYSFNFYGPCHCENCKKEFMEQYGMELPKQVSFGGGSDPVSRAHGKFKNEISAAQKKRISALIRRVNPDIAYCSEDYVRQESNTEYGRNVPHWQYSASSNVRAIRGMGVPATNADVDFMGFSLRHVSVSPAMQELRLWQTLANFGGLDYYMFGRPDKKEDRAALERVKKVFRFAGEHEDVLYGADSVADVLLVKDAYAIPNPEERGWIRAMTESHILFDEVLTSGLANKDLGKYRVVILPEKAVLAGSAAEKITGFVSGGGRLIVVGRPTMDASQKPISCLGIRQGAKKDQKALGAMLHISPEEKTVFSSFRDRDNIPVGADFWPVTFEEDCQTYLTYLMPQRFGPPEVCYATEVPTAFRGLSIKSHGAGKCIYIPWYPGTSYYKEGYDIWLPFMADVLQNICGVRSVGAGISAMVEVTHGRKDDVETVHFVNGAGHFGVSFFDPPVLTNQTVEILRTAPVKECISLYGKNNVRWQQENGVLRIAVPALEAYECIVIR